jgi:hypothetical protein
MSAASASGSEAANLFSFAASGSRLLVQVESDAKCAREHSLLARLSGWLVQNEDAHRRNLQDGTACGLLAHLGETWGWTTAHDQVGCEFRAALGATGSSADLGRMVDAELTALLLGVVLQQAPHRYTCMLLEFLRARNWLPIASQVPLWHRSNTIYTFADLLAYDVDKKQLVLIELKTGFDHAYDVPISDLHREIDVFVDTHRTRHQQQLCWMHVVLGIELDIDQAALRGCIVRVSNAAGAREPDWSDETVLQFFTEVYISSDPAYANLRSRTSDS